MKKVVSICVLICTFLLTNLYAQNPHPGSLYLNGYVGNDGVYAVSLDNNMMVIYNVKEKKIVSKVTDKKIAGIYFSSNTKFLAALNGENGVLISEWNAENGSMEKEIITIPEFEFANFSPSGQYVVGTYKNILKIYSLPDGTPLEAFNSQNHFIAGISNYFGLKSAKNIYFIEDEKELIVCKDSYVLVYDISTGAKSQAQISFETFFVSMRKLPSGFYLGVSNFSYSGDKPNYFIYDGTLNLITSWRDTKKETKFFIPNPLEKEQFVFSDHQNIYLLQKTDANDLKFTVKSLSIKTSPFYIKDINFSENGKYFILTASVPGKKSLIVVYDWINKKEIARF